MDDDVEVKEREESAKGLEEGTEQSVVERKKERKIYRGEVRAAGDLVDSAPQMVQPMTRKIPGYNKSYTLPPTFIATKFTPVDHAPGKVQMTYFDPRTQALSYREVGRDFELNVLNGKRGEELSAEWQKAKVENFTQLARRIACTLGADPEVFVVDKKGEVVPAWEYLPEKKNPRSVVALGGALSSAYWDGFQAEFTTPGYHTCLYEMTNSIQAGLAEVYSAAKAKAKGYSLSLSSVVQINPDTLMAAKDEHVAFGCSPSFNAYGEPPVLVDGRTTSVRFAGGHLHIGLPNYAGKEGKLVPLVKGLDAVLGLAAVSLFASFDNPVRRAFYGKAGEYRLPRHGLEYRVLSNAWLAHPLITHLTFDLARAVMGAWDAGFSGIWEHDETETRRIINTHDVAAARKVLTKNREAFLSILSLIGGSYGNKEARELVYRIWCTGMESAIKDPEDLEGNWRLASTWDVDYAYAQQFLIAYAKLRAGKKV